MDIKKTFLYAREVCKTIEKKKEVYQNNKLAGKAIPSLVSVSLLST